MIVAEILGDEAEVAFSNESGGHRWQRIPPNEKRGRRHTSTVTVAVFPIIPPQDWEFSEGEIEWEAILGTGPGGQARNKTANVIRATHLPTGISVRISDSRSQWQNRQTAFRSLAARISAYHKDEHLKREAKERREQIGSGMRGDKIRTVRLQDGRVVDHRSKKKMSIERYLAGHLEDLH